MPVIFTKADDEDDQYYTVGQALFRTMGEWHVSKNSMPEKIDFNEL